jgi:hypothetical protein
MALTKRSTKGSPLTHAEMDANFDGLADGSLITALDSSKATFTQSGSGAVATDIEEEIRALPSRPEQFGDSINTAITAHRRVQLGAGTYSLSAAITPATDTVLQGIPQDKNGLAATEATIIESSASKIIDLGTSGAHSVKLKSLQLKPVTADQASTYGIYGEAATFLSAEDVIIKDQAVGVYHEKSQQHTYDRMYIRSCGQGMHFAADAGTYNVDWFNNIISIRDSTVIDSAAGPNIDFQGAGLHVKATDITGITNTGTRASVRIRDDSYNATIEDFYFEPVAGQTAGGDVFLCEGGVTRIKGGYCQGGATGTRVANVISAKSGAVVIVEGITGSDFFDAFVTADGAGTVVYVMPGAFGGAMTATNRFVETNGGKVIELGLDEGSFTATLTGCTTSPTGTVNYIRHGNLVTLLIPSISAESNTTAATLTGLPASLTPASNNNYVYCNVLDSGAAFQGVALVNSSSVIALHKGPIGTAFTNSGVKGVQAVALTYTLF